MRKFAFISLLFLSFGSVDDTGGDEYFKEFHVYPDDENDQIKVSWMPTEDADTEFYVLERSRNNEDFNAWRKVEGLPAGSPPRKFFEVDFDAEQGWSFYRIKEIMRNGTTNYTPTVPVFLGIEKLRKGERIVPKPLVGEGTKKISLLSHDGKSYILVLRDRAGEEYFYDQKIRADKSGLFIEEGSELQQGKYTITASSVDELMGLNILVK